MSADPFRHRLIHVLLREQLGGQTPPDLTDQILDRALDDVIVELQSNRRTGRIVRLRWVVSAAAAAVVILALGIWAISRSPYPAPKASGDFHVVTGDAVGRGSTIRAGDSAAVVELGGYCRIDLGPKTTLRIDGEPGAEEVFLYSGTAVCSVDSDVGKFGVLTELGTARVSGTEFTVRLEQRRGRGSMWVQVASGQVEVDDGSQSEVLLAGGERTIFVGDHKPKPPEIVRRDKPTGGDEPDLPPDMPTTSTGESTSSSDDSTSLRAEIRDIEKRTRELADLIRKTREENAHLKKQLEAKQAKEKNPRNPE